MTGTASSQVVSAFIAETTAGTIPSSPGFTTSHAPINLTAGAEIITSRSQVSGGSKLGHGIQALPVSGDIPETPLIYGVYDTWLSTLLQSSWSTNTMDDGKSVTTCTVENKFPAGVGGTDTMLRYRGIEATGGTLRLASGQDARISFTLAGRGSDDGTTTALNNSTYTDPTEADPLSSGVDVGTITMAGYTLDCIESCDINFNYEARDPQARISSDDMCGITRGNFVPTITANFYIESNFLAMYNAARDRTTSGFTVVFPIGSVAGEKYTFEFHECYFGPVNLDLSGSSLMQSVEIIPAYSASDSCVLTVTRAI